MATWDLQDVDETQTEFQNGILTDVETDNGDYLRLADTDVLSFDGIDDYVSLPSGLVGTGQDFTVEIGFNPDNVTSTDSYKLFVLRADIQFILAVANTDYALSLWNGVWNTIADVSTGTYYFVSVVYDDSASEWVVYLDGVEKATLSASSSSDSEDNNVLGTGASLGSIYAYDGILYEARIWHTVCTQTKIQNNVNKRLTGTETDLYAYWKLNEGTGTTATDSAGTNDGTLVNGPTWVANEPLYFMNANENNNRTVQLDLSSLSNYDDSLIEWTATLNNQSLTLESRYSLDSGSTWSSWQTCISGDPIPGLSSGDDLSNALLECRETLSTSDVTTTPQLETRSIYLTEKLNITLSIIKSETQFTLTQIAININFDLPIITSENQFSITTIKMGYSNIVCTVQPQNISTILGIDENNIFRILNTR